jgi:hypothetical protein
MKSLCFYFNLLWQDAPRQAVDVSLGSIIGQIT